MVLLREDYLRTIANDKIRKSSYYDSYSTGSITKSLLESYNRNFNSEKNYDIFLSHSYLDKTIILGLSVELESYGYSVYVDWIEDSKLDRTSVTPKSVNLIKQRMKSSKCLLYATSRNSTNSKWMPWELGFMDGFCNKVAILPITNYYYNSYKGTEYLSIYPFADKEKVANADRYELWVNDQQNSKLYARFRYWMQGGRLTIHK